MWTSISSSTTTAPTKVPRSRAGSNQSDDAVSTSTSLPPAVLGFNQVERWFGLITDKMIRRGTFHSVEELERAIYSWLTTWNDTPKAFVCKASADVILDKVRRCKELSGTAH